MPHRVLTPTKSQFGSTTSHSSSEDTTSSLHSSRIVGSHKVHYHHGGQWDFVVNAADSSPVDLSLVLPHYRAHNQPAGHRMSMYISSEQGEIRAKVCRRSTRTPFFLYVHATGAAPVTIYLPSDFAGVIRLHPNSASSPPHSHSRSRSQPSIHSNKRLTLSPGFMNNIYPRVTFPSDDHRSQVSDEYDSDDDNDGDDEVEVSAEGHVTFKMWDVREGSPESAAKETWKLVRKSLSSKNLRGEKHRHRDQSPRDPSWDFLLEG